MHLVEAVHGRETSDGRWGLSLARGLETLCFHSTALAPLPAARRCLCWLIAEPVAGWGGGHAEPQSLPDLPPTPPANHTGKQVATMTGLPYAPSS